MADAGPDPAPHEGEDEFCPCGHDRYWHERGEGKCRNPFCICEMFGQRLLIEEGCPCGHAKAVHKPLPVGCTAQDCDCREAS